MSVTIYHNPDCVSAYRVSVSRRGFGVLVNRHGDRLNAGIASPFPLTLCLTSSSRNPSSDPTLGSYGWRGDQG